MIDDGGHVSVATVAPVIERILVGLDGSMESASAAEWALALADALGADALGAELIAFHAVGLLDVWPTEADADVHHNDHTTIRRALDEWSHPLVDRGVRVR